MPHTMPRGDPRDRDSTILMIQWTIWKHLGPRIIIDGERMQQLAEILAHEFYAEGVRMPLDDDETETAIRLTSELLNIASRLMPTLPERMQRERARKAAQQLFRNGWRKFSEVA